MITVKELVSAHNAINNILKRRNYDRYKDNLKEVYFEGNDYLLNENDHQWFNNWQEKIDQFIDQFSYETNIISIDDKKIVLQSSYQCYTEHGFSDTFVTYKIIIKPSFQFDIDLKIIGNFGKYQDVKEMLYGMWYDELTE